MSGDNLPEDFWREPLPPTSLEIEPPEPGKSRFPRDAPDLNLSGEVWDDDADDDLAPLGPSGLAWGEVSVPAVAFDIGGETWLRADDEPPEIAAAAGPIPAAEAPAFRASGSCIPMAFRRRLVLAAMAAVCAAALGLGFRVTGSDDAGSDRPSAAAIPAASATVLTSPPASLPTTVVTAPPVTTSSSTSTSTTSSTVPPTTTTPPPPATTAAPTTARPVPTTAVRAPATVPRAADRSTSYGPLCGFVPGSTVDIDLNGVPVGRQVAGPDGCVSGSVVVAR